MADASILGALLRGEENYLAEDPWFRAGASTLKAPMPQARTNAEALLLPLLQGAAGGFMTGYGRNQAEEAQRADYSSSLAQLLGSGYQLPRDVDPQMGMANALLDYQAKQEENIEGRKEDNLLSRLLLSEAGAMIDPTTNTLVPVPGLAELKANEVRLKKSAENEASGEDWLKRAPANVQTKLLQADSATKELYKLSQDFAALKSSAPEFQAKQGVSGTKENEVVSRMKLLLPTVIRLSGEVGNIAEQEQARALAATLGNWTSGAEGAATRVRQAAELYRNLALRQAQTAKEAYGRGGGEGIISALTEDLESQAGVFEPTVSSPKYKASDLIAQGYTKGPNGWVKP